MTNGGRRTTDPPHAFTDEELTWIAAHVTDLRRSVTEKRFLRWALIIGFVMGLAAHVAGYLLRPAAANEPIGLLADLLYALGYALWTGVVVAIVIQIFPEWKQRQLEWYLNAYDQAVRDKSGAGGARSG
jgi:hypothetical protein